MRNNLTTLRQAPLQAAVPADRPVVGILIDGLTGFGRAVMRGVMRYANLQRRWIIHEELRHIFETPLPDWPECDGAIVAGVAGEAREYAIAHSRHFIHCSGSADPSRSPVVCMDDYAVGTMAAEHLMDCRLEHFGFYGYRSDSPLACNRFNGFCDALASRGFTCYEPGLGWTTSVEWQGPRDPEALIDWLQVLPKPVGIMAIDDSAAHELASVCLRANIAVPERVAIIGVNNDDLLCESAWPPLSSVNCDYSRTGYIAASLLDKLLQGQALQDQERIIRLPPLGVIRRQSTDILALDNPDLVEAIRYIREHACDPCTVSDVLRHVPVNRRWLERQFVATLGRTPHDEIMRVRIEVAKRLLLQPELSLPDIAIRCGFAANQNFGRAFLKLIGTTPGAYRRTATRGAAQSRPVA